MYIGLKVQGSNDNLPDTGVDGENRPASEIARMTAEHQGREKVNMHWLQERPRGGGRGHPATR